MNSSKCQKDSSFMFVDFEYLLSEWKQMLSADTLARDIWAGVTVALVALPLNLALAIAAGVPPGVGITTGIVAGVLGGLFGGQRYAVTGPAAAMAVVLVEIADNYGLNALWLVCLIAGLFQLVAGCLKLGRFIAFLPMPVIVGFANAIGVLVFFNAIDDFLGLPTKSLVHPDQLPLSGAHFVPDFIVDLTHVWFRCLVHSEMNIYAVLIGAISILIAYLTPKITKALPGQLVAIIVATVITSVLGFKIPVIRDVAAIPNMLPTPMIPNLPWNDLTALFPMALTVFMLGSIESLLSASVADGMTGTTRHRPNQELIGQGICNLVVPFFGGIPVTGVIARTAVNIRAGAQTRLAAISHALVLACLIFFLAKFAEQIPLAALAAILMVTGLRLIEWDAMRAMWNGSRTETLVALATSITAVLIDLTAGVFLGLAAACILFICRMSDVKLIPQDEHDENDIAKDLPSCKFVRTYVADGPLFFGAAERFIENIVIVDDVKVIILHMKAVRMLDLTGLDTLYSIQKQLNRQGGRLVLAELPPQPMQLLERTGALEHFGQDNIFSDYRTALVTVNSDLLQTSCLSCEKSGSKSQAPKDCRLRVGMMDEASPISRLIQGCRSADKGCDKAGLEWLFSVDSLADIPTLLCDTPLDTLLRYQNLGLEDHPATEMAELVIGMCIDFRNSLNIPRDWSYMIRREGANMDGAEFAIALAVSKGVRHMALIAHNDCAMANTLEHRDNFVEVLTRQIGWDRQKASEFFDKHARTRQIDNEIDFVLKEAKRIEKLFPGLTVVPLLFRVDDDKLYLIYDWLRERTPEDKILRKLNLRDTGQFFMPSMAACDELQAHS